MDDNFSCDTSNYSAFDESNESSVLCDDNDITIDEDSMMFKD